MLAHVAVKNMVDLRAWEPALQAMQPGAPTRLLLGCSQVLQAQHEPAVVKLAHKVRYRIDPDNPYPNNFTGHIRATLRDGRTVEERQPHLRGGAHEPLTRRDIEEKFVLNAQHGGWDAGRIEAALELARTVFDGAVDLHVLRG